MRSRCLRSLAPWMDRRGIALPVSLFALLAITVIITGVLLTSSTEVAMSFAHRDATENLHLASGAAEAYVARKNGIITPGTFAYTAPGSSESVTLTVERMAEFPPGGTGTDSTVYFSIQAEPEGGGRGVVTTIMYSQSPLGTFAPAPECGLCLAGSGDIRGTAPPGEDWKISNGANSLSCPADSASANSIVFSADAAVTINGATRDQILGDTAQSTLTKQDFITSLLGGISMRDLGWNADIKFGGYFSAPPFETQNIFDGNGNANYDWSCPGQMDTKSNCWTTGDTTEYVSVAIDAQNDTVEINNWHGQGMLVVINGTLKIGGNFLYRGLILTERNIVIAGGGSTPPSIEGAVISADETIVDDEAFLSDDDSYSGGKAQVTFNRCAINAVANKFNSNPGTSWTTPQIRGSTQRWFEVLR